MASLEKDQNSNWKYNFYCMCTITRIQKVRTSSVGNYLDSNSILSSRHFCFARLTWEFVFSSYSSRLQEYPQASQIPQWEKRRNLSLGFKGLGETCLDVYTVFEVSHFILEKLHVNLALYSLIYLCLLNIKAKSPSNFQVKLKF